MPDTTDLVLPLTDVSHLFNAPRVDPLSRSPAEVLGTSGVDYLFSLLHMNWKRARSRRLVVLLPPEKVTAASAAQATRGLHRVMAYRIERELLELRSLHRHGWKVTGIAVLLLAACLGISSLFRSDVTSGLGPLLRQTLESGFEIVGWVLLWRPIELLGYVPVGIRFRIATLRAIRSMDVEIRPDDGPSSALQA
jgi:hypothetical protein